LLACGAATPTDAVAPVAAPLTGYGAEAVAARAYTSERLAHYRGAARRAPAPFVAHPRRNPGHRLTDPRDGPPQISADATLVRLGAAEYRCEMDKALAYLERLWAPDGGYAPRADLDGMSPSPEEKFADDNALIGLTYLDAAAATPDPNERARYLA